MELGRRLGIAQAILRGPDCRDELNDLLSQSPSRAAFCKATGISQDMLSHMLAGS